MALLPEGFAEFERLARTAKWGPYFAAPYVRSSDAYAVLWWLVVVCLLRIALCGLSNGKRNIYGSLSPIQRFAQTVVPARNTCKLVECIWYLLWHTTSTILCFYCFFNAEWVVDGTPGTSNWAKLFFHSKDVSWYLVPAPDDRAITGATGWPNLHPSEFMRQTYLLQLAFWISCLVFISFESRKSDFYVLLSHHVATITLVGFSWTLAFYRMGLLVLLLHDPVDMFLYFTKTLYYVNKTQEYVTMAFSCLLGSYAVLRLVAFPILCVYPAWTMDKDGKLFGKGYSLQPSIPGGVVLPSCLVLLQVMHFYWFHLLATLAVGKINGEKIKDTTDADSEEECVPSKEETELSARFPLKSDRMLSGRRY